MAEKKLDKPVILTTIVEDQQHEALRYIAYKEKMSMAEVVRKALKEFIRDKSKKYPEGIKIPQTH